MIDVFIGLLAILACIGAITLVVFASDWLDRRRQRKHDRRLAIPRDRTVNVRLEGWRR